MTTSTSSAEIRTQIATVERQRREAAQLEQERIAAENEHRRQIAESEQQLERLRRAELEATIQELKASHTGKVAAWDSECKALFARLESPSLMLSDLTPALLNGVGNAYNVATDSAGRIASAVQELAYDATYETRVTELMQKGQPRYLAERQLEPIVRAAGNHIQGLTVAANPPDTLAMWVSRANGDFERRKRQAVALLLTGFMLDPTQGFQPNNAFIMPRMGMG
jgi:hypothetical protein